MTSNSLVFPPLVDFDGNWSNWSKVEDQIYQIFKADFVERQPTFTERLIKINFVLDENRELDFWHMTTRDYAKDGNRSPELQRAVRIRWIRFVIEYFKHPEIDYYQYLEGNGRVRHYFWVPTRNYIVILEATKTAYVFRTAHVVDKEHQRKDFERKSKARHIPEPPSK